MSKPLTGPQARALVALRDLQDARQSTNPRSVARVLWPDSPGWDKVSRRGSTPAGGALGATMPMKAAQILWRLREHGMADLPYDSNRWSITEKGRAYLAGENTP